MRFVRRHNRSQTDCLKVIGTHQARLGRRMNETAMFSASRPQSGAERKVDVHFPESKDHLKGS